MVRDVAGCVDRRVGPGTGRGRPHGRRSECRGHGVGALGLAAWSSLMSIESEASIVGALLAAAVAALTVWAVPEESLVSWGWRLPFLFGGALAGLVLITRATLEETPEFLRQRDVGTVPENPIRQTLKRHRGAIGRGFAISALGSITYYVGITYVPTFLDATGTMPETRALSISVLAALTVILVTPIIGLASDRFGRRPTLLALALASIILPTAMFAAMVGGRFKRHPAFQSFEIKVIDKNHPSTSILGETWTKEDECYYLQELNPAIQVLLAADLRTVKDENKATYPGRIFGDYFPLAWCHEYEGGRVFFTALGHDAKDYSDSVYLEHLEGGILWALGKD